VSVKREASSRGDNSGASNARSTIRPQLASNRALGYSPRERGTLFFAIGKQRRIGTPPSRSRSTGKSRRSRYYLPLFVVIVVTPRHVISVVSLRPLISIVTPLLMVTILTRSGRVVILFKSRAARSAYYRKPKKPARKLAPCARAAKRAAKRPCCAACGVTRATPLRRSPRCACALG